MLKFNYSEERQVAPITAIVLPGFRLGRSNVAPGVASKENENVYVDGLQVW
jgi:hypothetical protein